MRISLPLVLSALLSIVIHVPADAEDRKLNGWIFEQKSEVMGDQTVYVTRDAIKAVSKKTNVIVICKAPDFEVISYNDATRCRFSMPLKSYLPGMHKMLAVATGVAYSDIPLDKVSERDTYDGLKSQTYVSQKWWDEMRRKAKIDRHEKLRTARSARMTVTAVPEIHNRLALFFSRYYGIPNVRKFPLNFGFVNKKDEFVSLLSTSSCRKAALKDKQFAVPIKYRLASDFTDVILNSSQQGSMDALFQGLSDSYNRKDKK